MFSLTLQILEHHYSYITLCFKKNSLRNYPELWSQHNYAFLKDFDHKRYSYRSRFLEKHRLLR